MKKCALCKSKDANQTGSHIIPLGILKSLVTEEEGKPRHKEATFSLSGNNFDTYYFGNSYPKEKIEKLLGREITDDEIESNKKSNQFTADFLCVPCEKRFTEIENCFYGPYLKLLDAFSLSNEKESEITNKAEIVSLFFISIFWRISVTRFGNFKFDAEFEERIRLLLDKVLISNKKDLLKNIEANKNDILKYPMFIGVVQNKGNLTANFAFAHPENTAPYSFLINEFVLFFFKDDQPIVKETFFEIEKLITNYVPSKFKITKITLDDYTKLTATITKTIKNVQREVIKYLFTEKYKTSKNKPPDDKLVTQCLEYVTNVDLNKVDSFTTKNVLTRLVEFYNKNCLSADT